MPITKADKDAPNVSEISTAAKQLIESVSQVVTVRAAYVASDLIHAQVDYATWDDYEEFPIDVPKDAALVVLIVDAPSGLPGTFEIVQE